MALGFLKVRAGDVICALRGGPMFSVRIPQGYEYVFIGECYVREFIDGKALKLLEDGTSVI
jgi:hypothetical protein